MKQVSDIETNRMNTWSDMATVKQNLWKKLHGAKSAIKDGATQLAQMISERAQKFTQFAQRMPFEEEYVQLDTEDNNIQLSQVDKHIHLPKGNKALNKLEPSTKHLNTQRTMILYFCIMTVLMCCCLGKCLVVPISQASRFELNSRKHMAKLDKNAFIQHEVVQ